MTYLVTDNCVKCKHTDCVEVCPVDCFYEVDDMLVINPLECIDCGVCEPECPVDAIIPDNAISGEEHDRWYAINEQLSETGVNITEKIDAPPDAAKYNGIPNKYEQYIEKSIPIIDITEK